MSRYEGVDPELIGIVEIYQPLPSGVRAEDLPALRNFAVNLPSPDTTRSTKQILSIDTPAGALALHVYHPLQGDGPRGCILHLHGGGFIVGEARLQEAQHLQMAADLDCVFVSVDYRLAPETRFPGNIEDCYAALAWVFRNAVALGIDPRRIGVMGESAGGGLAAALALMARDRGEFALAFQHLIYPMLDDRTCTRETAAAIGQHVWTRESNRFGWTCLLGQAPGGPDVSPYAAAARATDLAGLPPTFLSVGALDLFVEENLDYGRRLLQAGVPTEVHVWPGAVHAFDADPSANVAIRAREAGLTYLARVLR